MSCRSSIVPFEGAPVERAPKPDGQNITSNPREIRASAVSAPAAKIFLAGLSRMTVIVRRHY